MPIDTLSDVLQAVRLKGAVYFNVAASPPWAAQSPDGSQIAPEIVAGAERLIHFHVVTEGSCWGTILRTGESRPLEAGDVIVFPHGDAHVMSSRPELRGSTPSPAKYRRPPDRSLPFQLHEGEGPVGAKLVCGFLGWDLRPFNPLLSTLPPVLIANGREGSSHWLEQLCAVALAESTAPSLGGESVLARLSELMFVEVVRRYLATLPPEETGWLAGLRDEQIGRALAIVHARPAQDWSLDSLAKEVGMSRSAFAERFSHFMGQPPMQYLTHWRMQVASGLLISGGASIATIAAEVGYDSEAAFSRAFKKSVGVSPSHWRKARARTTSGR